MQPQPHSARRTLSIGRWTMVLALFALLASSLVAYGCAECLSLPTQIAAHLLLPVAAGLLKLGYVVRLAAHHALGNYAVG